MELILEKDLKHQEDGVKAVNDVFEKVFIEKPDIFYSNPIINLEDEQIYENINKIKNTNSIYDKNITKNKDFLNIDVKMETGTGKTYVYTKTIFELNKNYGLNKFIILVPSLAIKAGTAQFISDGYVKRHFRDVCDYKKEINLGVLNTIKNKNKKKKTFPSVVADFLKGTCQNSNKIYVLLVNGQLITNGNLLKDNYDKDVEGFYNPFDALKATKSVLIIDEPHRFQTEKITFTSIIENINPQCIIRYGATFPEITEGKGKNKITRKDYKNLVYDLNACDSFNLGLIKGVAKEQLGEKSDKDEIVKIKSIITKKSVTFECIKGKEKKPKTFPPLGIGESLSNINDKFGNIYIEEIKKDCVKFSNGVEMHKSDKICADIYLTSYQENMIKLALQRHFEIEKENFCSRNNKIKTLALFFIDDISSYRGENPYLLKAFERLLCERINEVLKDLPGDETEYREFLQASLADISKCHAGYFSQDNSQKGDEEKAKEIAKEIDEILHGKKQLLSFKNEDGSYNCRRFLFSKWTLKEGWDNPNVFTIAKLRSSGSEISKLQEVGRGLRLPVDERGNRISNEEFKLNYIVDFTESDFAQKLVDEINNDLPDSYVISREKIELVAKKMNISLNELFKQLIAKDYIDFEYKIIPENREAFFEEYPDFATIKNGKIIERKNGEIKDKIKINKKAFDKLKGLWKVLNRKYLIFYEPKLENILEDNILGLFENNVFEDLWISSSRQTLVKGEGGREVSVAEDTGVSYKFGGQKSMPYNEFLKAISKSTNIPIQQLHSALCKYAEKHGNEFSKKLNTISISNFIKNFEDWKAKSLQGHFKYKQANVKIGATELTEKNGSVKEYVTKGSVGTKIIKGTPTEKYLYDKFAYDSDLERENITKDIESVKVYGKIPRKSIRIPTFIGTYSPDFMYIVKRENGEEDLNLIVETKDVATENDLRNNEKIKIECAKIFFNNLKKDGYNVYFEDQLNKKGMGEILEKLVKD